MFRQILSLRATVQGAGSELLCGLINDSQHQVRRDVLCQHAQGKMFLGYPIPGPSQEEPCYQLRKSRHLLTKMHPAQL